MATIEISDDWLQSTGLSPEEAKDYLLNYPVMAEICLYYMTSTVIRTPPNSIIGHARVMLNGIEGPITERQSEDLRLIIHSAEFLFEHLSNFINMVSSVFKRHTLYLNSIDVKEIVTSTVRSATQNCKYGIEYHIPDSSLIIQSDQILFERLLAGMLQITKQVRPTCEGAIAVSIEQTGSDIKISILVAHDPKYPFEFSSHDPFVFMAHSLAKELKGDFRIIQQEDSWQIVTSLPVQYE